MGAWGFGCGVDDHLHINEAEFVAEVIDAAGGDGAERGELVLTNLGRLGSPLIRYRTGDLVERSREHCACGRKDAFLKGGVLGRVDDMVIVRGVNVFPSAIENIVREFQEIGEFEVAVEQRRQMAELLIKIEADAGVGEATAVALTDRVYRRLNLKPVVRVVEPKSLPRYELKAARFKKYEA
jgi:phenylacetate-CoA ligase